ncbi:MAG: N-acetylmuramoyl-L-alanine amidase, partial [Clostridia bacterium]|nr:N-acetylmuramoyl-L-alanine amidase [Clostridia bacterium]
HIDDYVKAGNTYVLGKSDPAYPLYYNGKKLPRTQNGYFNMYVTVKEGENDFKFIQNGKETVITLKTFTGTKAKNDPVPMDGIDIVNIYPMSDIITLPGKTIELSCTAPAGSTVTVSLGTQNVELKPQGSVKTVPKYLPQTYKGTLTLPDNAAENTLTKLGKLIFEAKLSGESVSSAAAEVTLKPENYNVYAEVTVDYTHLKKTPASSFYDDYLPSSVGMRDYIESLSDGYYKLRFGGYIASENAKIVEATLSEGRVLSVKSETNEENTVFSIETHNNMPLDARCEDGTFKITLFNAVKDESVVTEICDNPLFSAVTCQTSKNMVIYKLKLKNSNNYYGFNYEYVDGFIVFTFRNPKRIPDNDRPLEGITVIVDPGHGGTDVGALGYVSEGDKAINEKDINLLTATAAARNLEKLGATVIMTRTDDVTMELSERMQFVDDTHADLCISVHHNSLDYTSNITRVRGFVGLWWDNSGALLAKTLSGTVTRTLSRYERTPSPQKLAMCRNHKYPSALLEMAFMTSAEEYESITTPANINLAGEAIANGVVEYYKAQEKYL